MFNHADKLLSIKDRGETNCMHYKLQLRTPTLTLDLDLSIDLLNL